MKKNNIILIGLMGSGKSSVGRAYAQKFGLNFLDFDNEIERNCQMSICDIFAQFGEKYFRELEAEQIEKLSGLDNFVISTGGGIVDGAQNVEKLKKCGKVFYLYASPKVLYERVKGDFSRPLLNCENPIEKLENLYDDRRLRYELADFIVDTEKLTVDEVVEKIYEKN